MQEKGFLLIVRGLPGCGKTTIIDKLVQLPEFSVSLRLNPDKVDVLCQEFISFCGGCPKKLSQKKKIYRYLLRKSCTALKNNETVIWEQPWRNRDLLLLTLENIAVIAYELKYPINFYELPFLVKIIEISISTKEALDRVRKRFDKGTHTLTVRDFSGFVGKLESFENLNFPFLRLDGTKPTDEIVFVIERFIKEIGDKK